MSAPKTHTQVHRPTTGDSGCTCGKWTGPMTALPDTDPRSFQQRVKDNQKQSGR